VEAGIHVVEQLQPVCIQLVVKHDRVVQRIRIEPGVFACPPRLQGELGARAIEQRFAFDWRDAVGVRGTQVVDETPDERRIRERIRPARGGAIGARRLIHRDEERLGTAIADEGGERFVECGLPRHVDRVVQQFVENRLGEALVVVAQQRRQQRIVEPPERTERDRRTCVGIVSATFELGGERVGVGAIEIRAIRHLADDRKPPGVGLEAISARRGHDVHDLALLHGRERRVAPADRQPERVTGEGAHRQRELELRPGRRVELPLEQRGNRLPSPEQPHLFVCGADHIPGGAPREHARERDDRDERSAVGRRATHDTAAGRKGTTGAALRRYCSWYRR
jgi:hypothetical protein